MQSFSKSKRRVTLAHLLMVCVIASSCTSQGQSNQDSELVYGLTLSPSGIDPHINASAELGIPLRSVYDTLVYRTQGGEFVSGLAKTWQASGDGLTYTFVLRDDVIFHDGTPFNAESVKVNLERILNPANSSAKAAQLLGPVSSIQVHDAYTVSIILSQAFAPLMDGLSQPYLGMASPSALSEYDTSIYQFHQVGTGPYRFVEYVVNDRLVLERNPDYKWGPGVVTNQVSPAVNRLVFMFYSDPVTRTLALENGEAAIMGELLPTDAKRIMSGSQVSVIPVPIPGQPLQFMINTTRKPLDNAAVRRALILAADRQSIVQTVYQGFSPIAYGPLSRATQYYDPGVEGLLAYDPVQSVTLFNSSGLNDTDGDGWRDVEGTPVEFTIVVPPWGLTPDVAQLLKSQWESTLKVKVLVRQVASFVLLSGEAEAGDYDLISLNFFGADPAILNSFYTSSGFFNWSRFSDPELDSLLNAGQGGLDPQRRQEIYSEVQRRIMDNATMLPIRDYVNLNGVIEGIQGLHFDAQGWFPYLTDIGFGQ